jgi:hypothetical protein
MFDEQPDGDPHGECAAEIHRLQAELNEIMAAIPGTTYMDPPDGGAPSLAEQVRRMAPMTVLLQQGGQLRDGHRKGGGKTPRLVGWRVAQVRNALAVVASTGASCRRCAAVPGHRRG